MLPPPSTHPLCATGPRGAELPGGGRGIPVQRGQAMSRRWPGCHRCAPMHRHPRLTALEGVSEPSISLGTLRARGTPLHGGGRGAPASWHGAAAPGGSAGVRAAGWQRGAGDCGGGSTAKGGPSRGCQGAGGGLPPGARPVGWKWGSGSAWGWGASPSPPDPLCHGAGDTHPASSHPTSLRGRGQGGKGTHSPHPPAPRGVPHPTAGFHPGRAWGSQPTPQPFYHSKHRPRSRGRRCRDAVGPGYQGRW